jgi:hypothetical protein
MSDPTIGQMISVSVGNDRMDGDRKIAAPKVQMQVTAENIGLLKDRRLDDAELKQLQGVDGDGSSLSIQDLTTAKAREAAPFAVNAATDIFRAIGKRAPAVKLSQFDTDKLAAIDSKPIYAAQSSKHGGFDAYLGTLDKVGKAGVVMEVASDMAVLQLSEELMADPSLQEGYAALGLNTDPKQETKVNTSQLIADIKAGVVPATGKKLKEPMRQEMIKAVLAHPDIPIRDRVALLTALGVGDAAQVIKLMEDANAAIKPRLEALTQANYKQLGGPADVKLTSDHRGSGDGSTTNGVGLKGNRGVRFFNYDLSQSVVKTKTGVEFKPGKLGTNSQTFKPTKQDEVAVHIGAIGANGTSNTVTMKRGDKAYTFTVADAGGGKTSIVPNFGPITGDTFDDGFIKFDAKSNTVTFKTFTDDPITVTQASAGADEIAVNVSMFVTPIEKPEPIKMSFGGLFDPDSAKLKTGLDAKTKADLDKIAAYQQRTGLPIKYVAVAKGSQTIVVDPVTKEKKLVPTTDPKQQVANYSSFTDGSKKLSKDEAVAQNQDARFVEGYAEFTDEAIVIYVESSADVVASGYDKATMGPGGQDVTTKMMADGKKQDAGFSANDILTGARAWTPTVAMNDYIKSKGASGSDLETDATVSMRGGMQMTKAQYDILIANQTR